MSLTLDGTSGITSSGGTNVLQADAVITANLQNGAVTTAKIADLGVTEGKLANSAVATAKIADNAVTTAKINNAAVTDAKIDTVAATKLTGDVAAARITSALNASGSAPIYAARAWVNFNGTGTVAIRASGNVSSITDLGTGVYRVNFTTAMPDANYAVAAEDYYYASGSITQSGVGNQLTSSVDMYYMTFNAANFYDTAFAYVTVFR